MAGHFLISRSQGLYTRCPPSLSGTAIGCRCRCHLLGCLLGENLVGFGLLDHRLDHALLIG